VAAIGSRACGSSGEELDLLDGTPLLDVEPHVPPFHDRAGARGGWLEQRAHDVHRVRADARVAPARGVRMKVSTRNQLKGTVVAVTLGNVMATIELEVGGQRVVAAVTRESAEDLGLKVGDEAVALVKATSVMVGKPD
jgi:molybdate transport system regulatory protein